MGKQIGKGVAGDHEKRANLIRQGLGILEMGPHIQPVPLPVFFHGEGILVGKMDFSTVNGTVPVDPVSPSGTRFQWPLLAHFFWPRFGPFSGVSGWINIFSTFAIV